MAAAAHAVHPTDNHLAGGEAGLQGANVAVEAEEEAGHAVEASAEADSYP